MDPLVIYPRFLHRQLVQCLADTPVVVIQGARQVGKTSLALEVAKDLPASVYLSLDDPNNLAVAKSDPVFFLEQAGDGLLIIDEAQRAPELILPLKANVDTNRRPGRFLLTGSRDLLCTPGVGDSLAGRAETIELGPLTGGELQGRKQETDFVTWINTLEGSASIIGCSFNELDVAQVVSGGYPEAVKRQPERAAAWHKAYVSRLSSHDAAEVSRGGYAQNIMGALKLLASSGAAELVTAKLARSLTLSETTTATYLTLMREMRLIEELPSWGRSYRARASRRPKVFLNDSGLAAVLAGFTQAKALSIGGREYFGSLVEQFVALELIRQFSWSRSYYSIHHFRSHTGLEVDLLIEQADGTLIAIEVKTTKRPGESAWKNLERFRAEFSDRKVIGVCLHAGNSIAYLNDWLYLLPITALWEHVIS